jgi:small subunit ribosomal protein S1
MEKMKELFQKEEFKPFKEGDVVEGKVIGKEHLTLYLDLGKRTGVVYGREYLETKSKIKKLKVGDKVFAKIINLDNEEGFVELSLKGAEKEKLKKEFERMKQEGVKIKVKFNRQNRGGLLTKISGIGAFLPISQLKEKIEEPEKLKEFLGKEIEVKILSILPSGQLILSEKLAKEEEIEGIKIGDIVEGEVSGISDFGVFLKIGEIEGLIPSSEFQENLNFKIGDKVKVKVVEVSPNKVLFSLKLD